MNYFFYLLPNYMSIMFFSFYLKAFNSVYDDEFLTVHDGFPTFHNLTKLELVVESYCGEYLLSDFLKNSVNLQCLVFPLVS